MLATVPSKDTNEETTRTSSCYMDEDYPSRPEIQKPLPE